MNAEDMTVTWSRSDLTDSVVHQYGNHKDLNTDQIPQYRGRTSVFIKELQRGNTSLSLSNIRLSDEGLYSCTVESRHWEDKRSVDLRVEVIGSQPVITVESYDSETVSLLCKSEGWRPEPALQWMNSRRVNLTAEETETQRVADLSYSVKRRMTVNRSDIDTFFCRVTQRDHKKEGDITAAAIYDLVAPFWKLIAISVSVLLLVALSGFIIYNCPEGLQEPVLSPAQWTRVQFTLLPEEELDQVNLRKYDLLEEGF
ncbi:butyrophilin-like protein 8 [Salminus brasiliensis]|uniref:butyrophilin-like protein 8 n=1 Tax=Salminus brasiliensis TaxID=930266 RepID=UPI003B82F860